MNEKIFISYRRDDSSPTARGLRDNLVDAFGETVFMDVDEIRVGETLPQALDNALKTAVVLIVVIGPTWLRACDHYGRRRLDLPGDWVRIEIERCLKQEITIIPVLIGEAPMPPKDALPLSIADLADRKYVELRESNWKQDLQPLIGQLAAPPIGLRRCGKPVPIPRPRSGNKPDQVPRTLTYDEIQHELASLTNWEVVTSPLPGGYPNVRTELTRHFIFQSFDKAIEFMQAVVPSIKRANHHPRWENVFRTVTVWLSTWDTGHVVSKLDLDLAREMEGIYKRLEGPFS